jgi:porin
VTHRRPPARGALAVLGLLAALLVARGSGATERERLLGDPGGRRSDLERLGVTLQLFTNHYPTWKIRGGVVPGGELGHSASYDFLALADLEELVGLRGLTFLVHAKGQYDEGVNDDVGALSDPIDDADFDEAIYPSEVWAQQDLLGGRARLRLGFLEQQTIFDRNAFANSEDRQFLATFLDNTGLVPLPTGLGVSLVASLATGLEIAAGVIDGDNQSPRVGWKTAFDDLESLTLHVEVTLRVEPRVGLPGNYRLGVFRDGRRREVLGEGRSRRGHWGVYASFDQMVLREAADGSQGLGLFLRLARVDEDVSPAAWSWAAGLQYEGPWPGRDEDALGLGAYQAIASDALRAAARPARSRETGVELYYRIAVRPWLHVTPDLQVIFDPGFSGNGSNAVLATLRFRLAF